MGFWITALLWVGSLILGRVLQPRAPKAVDAKPEKFEGITAEEGRCIPVLWGTRQFKGSNIGWAGDFSTEPIISDGSTVGFKYYMGAQYLICIGPIDEVVAVHFNEKPVGVGVDSGTDGIVFAKSGAAPWATAHVASGGYANGGTLAAAVEVAMKAAESGDWRVGFGFRVIAGVNDTLSFKTSADGYILRTVTLQPGAYTGATFAIEVTTRINDAISFPDVSVSYSANRFSFFIEGSYTFILMPSPAKFMLGFRHDIEHSMPGDLPGESYTGEYDVLANRFIFSYGGTTAALHCTDAGFTAATLLGINTGADKTGLGLALSDVDFAVITAVYTVSPWITDVDIDDAAFFGTEGGVQGHLQILHGTVDQPESSYLSTQFGATAPAYRRLCYAIQRRIGPPNGMYVGDTNYPKPISFTLRRCPNQLGLTDEHHDIAGDANPACMLYEIFTDLDWGLGIPASQLNVDSFRAVGETLYAEGFGLSMILDATTPASDVVQEILRHIDGVLYLDHLTGLIAVRLARADYVVADLPLISPANAHQCDVKQRSWEETKNVVRLRYVDRAQNYTERVYPAQDLANINTRGGDIDPVDIPMPGISSERNARIAGDRALKVLSSLPRLITLRVNRESWSLRPGSAFRLTWPDWGITDMPCRVSTIGLGEVRAGEIRVQAVQDVIGPAWTGFVAPSEPPDDPAELPDLPEFTTPLGDQAIMGDMPMPTG